MLAGSLSQRAVVLAGVGGLHLVVIGALIHGGKNLDEPTALSRPISATVTVLAPAQASPAGSTSPRPSAPLRKPIVVPDARPGKSADVPSPEVAATTNGVALEIHGQLDLVERSQGAGVGVQDVVIRIAQHDANSHTMVDLTLESLISSDRHPMLRLAATGALAAGDLRIAGSQHAHWTLFAQVAERLRAEPMLAQPNETLSVQSGGHSLRLLCLGERMLDLPGGQFAALVFANADGRSDEPILWLARGLNYALLQLRFEMDGQAWLLRVPNPRPL
jgi:hypothetical protein